MLTVTSYQAFSAFVDLYLAIYPAVVLFNLQMSFKKKLALSFALGIGSVYVAIECNILRKSINFFAGLAL
jgi:hypothetical protein